MLRYLDLYRHFLAQRFKVLLEYRVNFLIGASSTVFLQAAGLLAIWAVMRQVPEINGWSFDEILLVYGLLTLAKSKLQPLISGTWRMTEINGWSFDEILLVYGLLTLAKSINHMFADNLWTLGNSYVRTGAFDRFLVRPIDPLFHLLADRFCHDGIGNFLVGAALVVKASWALGIAASPANVVYLLLAVASGGAIFVALNLITAVSSFWVVESIPVVRSVFELHEFARFPLSIYPRGIGILLTWLVPYGFASFYPASHLLGRDVGHLAWLGVPVAALLLVVAYRFWAFGLRHYASTGS